MSKLHTVTNDPGVLVFQCPACGNCHAVWTERPNAITGAKWGWNGSMDRPTFTPSVLVNGEGRFPKVCHSFVTDGRIAFCGDSTHALAGQTVELPEWN